MDRNDRPLGREKHVIQGSAHVGRREGGPVGGGSGRNSGGGGGGGLLPLIIVALVALLGGGGALGGLLGGGGGETLPSQPTKPPAAITAPASESAAFRLDTTVSKDARPKRVTLKGDGTDTTTILVYMCGTDLESGGGYATKDLQEMLSADLSDQVNLLVWTGGCKQWKNNVVSNQKNQIYKIANGNMALVGENKTLAPMTDPNTLAGFLTWAAASYPADRYELIFWDHGGGSVSGYGYDEVNPRSGSMTLDGIATALEGSRMTFDFIGFDACLMATLETALVCEPYADYLIASEETEPGCGWYYTGWLNALSKDPSMSALDMGKAIADGFVQTCAQVAPRQQATLSVIDLAELKGTVPQTFKAFAQATGESIKANDYQSIAAARGKTKEFSKQNKLDQVDLIHLADNVNTKESRALSTALQGAVKYNATSSNIQNANGLSIYFPYGRTSNVNKMAQINEKIGLDPSYTDCIKSFASVEVAGQTVAGGSSGQLDSLFGALMSGGSGYTTSSGSADAQMVAQLLSALLKNSGRSLSEVGLDKSEAAFLDKDLIRASSDYLAGYQFDPAKLIWTKKGSGKVLQLTDAEWDLIQDVELNVFVDDGTGYIDLGLDNVRDFDADGDLMGAYDQTWLSVNGQIVAYYMLSAQRADDGYKILGRIPAMLNGQRVDLIACFTDQCPQGEILGAQVCYDEAAQTATVAKGLMDIQTGDVIDFICEYYDYDRNYQDDYYLGDPLTVRGDLTLANIKMDNTTYIAAYRLTDIYHNHFWTPSI